MIKIVPLEPKHARIALYLRQSDKAEIDRMTGLSPVDAVIYSIAHTEKGFAAELDGVPAAVFGVADGHIWLVGTDEITKHPVTFYRVSKKIFPELSAGYNYLDNYIDARNQLTIRWLLWLGFTVEETENKNTYHIYWRRGD